VAEHNSEVDQFERKFREAEPEAVAQWTIYEVFAADQAGGVGMVTFYGHVSTKDRATGQPVRPCLIRQRAAGAVCHVCAPRSRPGGGRPAIPVELQALIARMASENRLWGQKRIQAELARTPFRSPRANAVAERWVRSVRSECLDHLIVFNEANLRRVLSAYVTYYNRWRRTARWARQFHAARQVPSLGKHAERSSRNLCLAGCTTFTAA
jgi:hypothetical protein